MEGSLLFKEMSQESRNWSCLFKHQGGEWKAKQEEVELRVERMWHSKLILLCCVMQWKMFEDSTRHRREK